MRVLPVATRLPAAMYREVGMIIFRYGLFEYRLIRACYALLDISEKQGRIAMREPRGQELVEMVRDLLALRGVTLALDFPALVELTRSMNGERDRLAHGIWVKEKTARRYLLLVTRGNWTPDPRQGSISRRIKPEGRHYDLTDLKQLASDAKGLLEVAEKINLAVRRVVSRQRRELLSRLEHHVRSRTRSTRRHRP